MLFSNFIGNILWGREVKIQPALMLIHALMLWSATFCKPIGFKYFSTHLKTSLPLLQLQRVITVLLKDISFTLERSWTRGDSFWEGQELIRITLWIGILFNKTQQDSNLMPPKKAHTWGIIELAQFLGKISGTKRSFL